MSRVKGLQAVVFATVVMAVTSTFADALWAAAAPQQRAVYGVVHGGLVLAVFGLTLGWLGGARRAALGAVAGLMIGVLSAALFYVLYPVVGVAAILVAWMVLWLAFAFLGNAVAARRELPTRTVARGLAGLVLAGIGFWAISGIWLGAHDPGLLYHRNLAAWCVAFAPGFAALLIGRPDSD